MSAEDDARVVELAREAGFTLGGHDVRPSTRQIVVAGRPLTLEPRVMQVLVALTRRRGEVVSRDDLVLACWGGRVVSEDAISRCIQAIRRLAEAHGGFSVLTITRVGYRLEEAAGPGAASGQAKDAAAECKVSICVLPFANMSGDAEQEYFSDGISEDIITDLCKVSALSVAPRNSAFQFKGKHVDLSQVVRELNVSHVLEGSVRKAGDRVRISAQLSDGGTGGHLWAERWDRDLTDIFAVQDEISQAVVRALKLTLLPEEKRAIELRGTASPDAYTLYLMARQYRASGNEGDPRREEEIVRLSSRATNIDPGYAEAWAQMALSQSTLYFNYGKGGEDGLAAAERALSLNADLAEAHAVKARHLTSQGRHADALAELEIALRLDPECWEANKQAGLLSFRQRRFEDAIGYYRRTTDLMEADFSSPMMLVSCYTALGETEAAQRAAWVTRTRAEQAVTKDRSNGAAIATGCLALAYLGEAEAARDWARRALLVDPNNMVMRYNLACALAAHLKDVDGAIDILNGLLTSSEPFWMSHAKVDPDLDAIRDDPRFTEMIAAAEARLAAKPDSARTSDT
jgi:adenylate cyclase